jgi:carboxyl-terminal processing protease
MSRGRAITFAVIIAVLVLAALVGAGYAVDRLLLDEKESFSLENEPVYREALFDIKSYYFKEYSEDEITNAAQDAVEKAEKEGVSSEAELTDVGVKELVKALEDPHSQYLNPSENKRLEQDLSGTFFGVGFTLRTEDERPEVVTVIKGSPAEKAGVKPGDVIMSVDGEDTRGESLDSVVLRIRGKEGTKVKIEVMREEKPVEFVITREEIQIPDLESELVDGKYGVLKVYEFNKGVGDKVRAAVEDLQAKGAQGFILDLRNNPGGLLDEAVRVSSVFVPEGVVVSYQTKGQKKIDEEASGGAATDKPLVVLTNGGSASSSEIVAGALKDHGRATLVGSKTYGKGSVQKVFDVGNGGAVKLTISLYFLPNGESIDGKGIEPDVKVEVEDDIPTEEQMQMDEARKVLQNLIDGKPATGELQLLKAA